MTPDTQRQEKWIQKDRDWKDYPVGTKAKAVTGGYWIRVERGWRWFNGSTFPTPGGDASGEVSLPDTQRQAEARTPFEDELKGEELAGIEAEAKFILSGQTDQEFVELNPDFALRWVKSYRNLQGEAWGRAIKQVALESLAVREREENKEMERRVKILAVRLKDSPAMYYDQIADRWYMTAFTFEQFHGNMEEVRKLLSPHPPEKEEQG